MIVQHRLIGNIPGRGHGDPLLSTAFPLDFGLATTTAYRSPDPGQVPPEAARISEDGKYQIFLSTFEIQATHFGRFALVSTNVFRPANMMVRPLIYMNMVVMTDEAGKPKAFLPPEELLTFNGFIQPAQFAALNGASSVLASTTWQPAPAPERRPFFAPKTAAHRALLARYWSAASSRMFGGNAGTLTICLGEQLQPLTIIENAKALLLCDILHYLPSAVRNIVSMSAGAVESSTRSAFKSTALAVVYPTAPGDSQPAFDLRRRDGYPALSAVEDQFIASLLENGPCSFMQDVIARFMKMTGCADESQISFTADYDFSLLLYQLECIIRNTPSALPISSCLAVWQQLNTCLMTRHRFSPAQVNEVLAGVESRMLDVLLASKDAAALLDESMLRVLWEKALTVEDALFPLFARLIAASHDVLSFPQLIESFPNLTDIQVQRTALLIRQIGSDYCTQHAMTHESVSRMTSRPCAAIIAAHPQLCDACGALVVQANQAFPDHLLTTLPLSCMLLDGRQALSDAIGLLRRSYAAQLPASEQTANLSAACSRFADQELTARLCDYFAECLPEQLGHLEQLTSLICATMTREGANAAFLALLSGAEQHGILLDAAQTHILFGALIPHCADPAALGQAYAAYENRLTAQTGESPLVRLDRLSACAGDLSAAGYDATGSVEQMLNRLAHQLLTPEQSNAFVSRLWPLCRQRERVAAAFHDYLLGITQDDPLFYFNNTQALRSLAPFIEANHTDMTDTVCGILEYIATSMPCAPIAQLSTFLEQLLPRCQDKTRVRRLFFDYIDLSIQESLKNRTDCFPWLKDMESLAKRYALADPSNPLALTGKMVQYLLNSCTAEHRSPSAAAGSWLIDLAHNHLDAFSSLSDEILKLYDVSLGSACGGEAAEQIAALLPFFRSTTGYPAVRALDQRKTSRDFCTYLQVLNLSESLNKVYTDMNRCGLVEDSLLIHTRAEAVAALRREFAALKTPDAFEKAHIALANSAGRRLHNEVLADAFNEFTARYTNITLSIEQIERINAIAKKLGSQTNSLPETVRFIADTITSLGARPAQFCSCMSRLENSGVNPGHVISELAKVISKKMPQLDYPQAVYAAMLCQLSDDRRRINWSQVFCMLGMELPQKLPQPYSPQGLAWLATIHAVCRAVEELSSQPGCNFGPQLLQCLKRDAFEAFRADVVSDKKHMRYYLGGITCALMKDWLSD